MTELWKKNNAIDNDMDAKNRLIAEEFEDVDQKISKLTDDLKQSLLVTLESKTSSLQASLDALKKHTAHVVQPSAAGSLHRRGTEERNVQAQSDMKARLDTVIFAVQDLDRRFSYLRTEDLMHQMIHQIQQHLADPANLQSPFAAFYKNYQTLEKQTLGALAETEQKLKACDAKSENTMMQMEVFRRATTNERMIDNQKMVSVGKRIQDLSDDQMKIGLVQDKQAQDHNVILNRIASLDTEVRAVEADVKAVKQHTRGHDHEIGVIQGEVDLINIRIGGERFDWDKQ